MVALQSAAQYLIPGDRRQHRGAAATMSNPFSSLRIRGRLIAGFAALSMILALVVGITLWKVGDLGSTVARMSDVRVPTATASTELAGQVYVTLAALRGWMLTGDQNFKTERQGAWKAIEENKRSFDTLSKHWTSEDNKQD